MGDRRKLFACRDIYALEETQALFLGAVRESLAYHRAHCPEYARLLERSGFLPERVKTAADLAEIPPLPTLYLKKHPMFSVPEKRLLFRSESSGTGGAVSVAGLDPESALLALRMVVRTFSRHRVFSPLPTNYVVLGYQPSGRNKMAAVKTAFGATLAAPALQRVYALRDTGSDYELNLEGVKAALERYQLGGCPVRFIGFPAYLQFLLELLGEEGIRWRLHPKSMILLAGGWKRFFRRKVDKRELFALAEERLGIREENCRDFFGAVEHPVLYCACENHRFHVPVYSRVIIRDVETLRPVPEGTPGILNLISPLVGSMPLTSVLTDDLAVLRRGCGCGIAGPYFELLGRAGLDGVKTCAVSAEELLGGTGK